MLPTSLAATGNKQAKAADLLRAVEDRAKLVREKLMAKSKLGDLELITFLDMVAERFDIAELTAQLDTCSPAEQDYKEVLSYIDRLNSFHSQIHTYLDSSILTQCIQLALDGVVDLQAFKVFKADWKRFRHAFMLDMHLSDTNLSDTFVFLECIGRMLLIHHEQQSSENTRKNLKLIDHLMLKHDLVRRLRPHKLMIKLTNRMGEVHGNQSLRNKLKDETQMHFAENEPAEILNTLMKPTHGSPDRDMTPRGSFLRLTPMFSNVKSTQFSAGKTSAKKDIQAVLLFPSVEDTAKRTGMSPVKDKTADESEIRLIEELGKPSKRSQQIQWPETMQVDASFLSDQSESSISFMDHDDARHKTLSKKKARRYSFTPGNEKSHSRRANEENRGKFDRRRVAVEDEIREITRERLFSKLLPIIGECRSRAASCNIEARLFGKNHQDETEYDVMYSKIIAFLDMLSYCPSLVTPLLDQQFDLDYMISRYQTMIPASEHTDKANREKTTQTSDATLNNWTDNFSRMTTLPSLDKASLSEIAATGDLDSRLLGQLRADETVYLQKSLLQSRQENDFLRKTMYEMRLSFFKRSDTKSPFL